MVGGHQENGLIVAAIFLVVWFAIRNEGVKCEGRQRP